MNSSHAIPRAAALARPRPLPLLVFLLASLAVAAAHAQLAAPAAIGASPDPGTAEPGLETIAVTGTLIRSAERVGYNQVQIIQAADIQDSGATTISEFLREVAVNSASSWADDFAYGATGGAGIALRGLSEKYTLVLVDGQRAAPYAEPSNGTDSFVDLNSIPLNAIQRIEIVKTGAVSQYGSDAIAGVVNIITRKNVTGLELGAGYGRAVGGTEATKKADFVGGWGDLARDRFNITASGSYFLQNGYTVADRSLTRSQTYANQPLGVNTQGADYWEPNGVGNGGAPLNPCPSSGAIASGGSILNGPGSGNVCAVNTANGTSLHPHEERFNGKLHASFAVADDVQAWGDLWASRNRTITLQGYNGIGDSTEGYDLQNVSIFQVSNIVPASNPYNPYGTAAALTYTFLGQPQVLTTTGKFYRAAAGLEGNLKTSNAGEWTWSASASHSLSSVGNFETGLLSVSGLANVLDGGVFDFSNPSQTPNGLAGLYTNDQNSASYRLDTLDLSAATSDLARLPGGDIGLGVGLQLRREGQTEADFGRQAAGLAIPFFLQSIDGQRNVAAAYYQLNVPILPTLSFSQSSRYDHYSDFGSAFSPRFALRLQPVRELTAYASYTRGFRAPSLAENSQSNSSGIQGAVDPNSPVNPTATQTYPVLVRGNPSLSPEHTRNYNLGLEFSPEARTSIGLDWYKVTIESVIGTGNIQTVIDANNPAYVVRNPNGTIAYVNFDYENLNTLDTDGLELTFRRRFPTTPYGRFTLSGDLAYVLHFRQTAGGITQDFAGNDGAMNTPFGASFPRRKGNVALGWAFRDFNTTATILYTGAYEQVNEGVAASTPSYSQINLVEAYTGWKNWTVSGTVKNVFNRQPPYYPLWLQFPTHVPFDQSLYSDEGRYLELDVRYRF